MRDIVKGCPHIVKSTLSALIAILIVVPFNTLVFISAVFVVKSDGALNITKLNFD